MDIRIIKKSLFKDLNHKRVLCLGTDSDSSISFYEKGKVFYYFDIGNLQYYESNNIFKNIVNKVIAETKPDYLVVDMHPNFFSTKYGLEVAKKHNIPVLKVQHHKAHVYSLVFGNDFDLRFVNGFFGIICDGLGFGENEKLWGGEIFFETEHIGSLEEQDLIGGDSSTIKPEKMLLSILLKFMDKKRIKTIMKDYFNSNEIDILTKQLEKNYNVFKSSSTGRVLDAACVLLGFHNKENNESPAAILERNSTKPLKLNPVIEKLQTKKGPYFVLKTTPLFQFLANNLDKDKKRLAATVQKYLSEGMFQITEKYRKEVLQTRKTIEEKGVTEQEKEKRKTLLKSIRSYPKSIIEKLLTTPEKPYPVIFSGGCAINKIMANTLTSKKVIINQNIAPGDSGISIGQLGFLNYNFELVKKEIKVPK